jgi:aryl-alcohol dehydrogenase-like predicted oxidoreductase
MAGNSRRWIVRACEASLRRLQTDRIDLYQVHRPSPDTDIDETLAALSDLVRQGKVLSVGCSTFPPSEIVESQWASERRNHVRFVSEQPPYSMLVRGVEVDVLPTCQRYGMAVIPWGPLGGGWLSGKWRKGATEMSSSRSGRIPWRYDLSLPANQQKLDATDALAQLAEDAGLSLVHLAVAWVANHPAVTAPIIGPRPMEQFKSQIGAADVQLDAEILDRIDEIVPPGTNFSLADSGYLPPAITDAGLRRR